jgi:hypothetical protein
MHGSLDGLYVDSRLGWGLRVDVVGDELGQLTEGVVMCRWKLEEVVFGRRLLD